MSATFDVNINDNLTRYNLMSCAILAECVNHLVDDLDGTTSSYYWAASIFD